MMKPTEKWAYSLDGEYYYSGSYDSFEKALTDGIKDAKAEGYNKVYIGRVMEFVPRVDADNVIDNIAQDAYDKAGEFSMDYLEGVSVSDRLKLETMLTETFNQWAKETNNEPRFYTVEETSEHIVTK